MQLMQAFHQGQKQNNTQPWQRRSRSVNRRS